MKFKLLTPSFDYITKQPCEVQAVRMLFEAATAEAAREVALRQIRWLKRTDEFRMVTVGNNAVSLGAQLWEPCQKCGTEPSYAQPGGHLCAACAQTDHPKISGSPYGSPPDEI